MRSHHWFYSPLLAFALTGCVPSVSKQQAEAIAKDSSQLLRHSNGEIAPSEWPESVATIQPERVKREDIGVFIITFEFFVHTEGLFILDPSTTYRPPLGEGDPGYELLAPGVYSFKAPG
jgi:hypothetical protein